MLHSKTKSKVSNGMRGHGAISKLGSEELPGRRLLALHVEVRALSSSEREGAPPLPTWLGKFARKTLTEKTLEVRSEQAGPPRGAWLAVRLGRSRVGRRNSCSQ